MRFNYEAMNPSGGVVRGELEAQTVRAAVQHLRAQGLIVTDVRGRRASPSALSRILRHFRRASLLQQAFLARHLALMVRAGVTVDRAFELLAHQATKPALKAALTKVHESIRKGDALATALSRVPHVFPPRFVAMVQWGEVGGTLPESLTHLATQLEHERDLQAKVRGAMLYPAIIVAAVIIVGAAMSIFVLPQLASLIAAAGVELPLLTRVLIAVSAFISGYAVIVFPLFVLLLLLAWALAQVPQVRWFLHAFYLRVPIIGGIARMVNLSRFNRSLGTLIKSGIPIVEGLKIAGETLGNVRYQRAVQGVTGEAKEGERLGTAFRRHPRLFPAVEVDMLTIGEETGKVDEVLLYLAEFYEEQVNQLTKNLAQTIEPLLLLIIGVVVGGIVLAVMMPIYQMAQSIV